MTSSRDTQDVNRGIAARALQERDQARSDLADTRAEHARQVRLTDRYAERNADLADRLVAISDLHQPDGHACTCGVSWPCPTRRVLDGTE